MTDPAWTRRELLATTLAGTASLLSSGSTTGQESRPNRDARPHEEYLLAVHPDAPGRVWVRLSVQPNGAQRLLYQPPDFVTVQEASGFDRIEDGLWWTGRSQPRLVYTVSPRFSWGIESHWGFASVAELTLPAAEATPTRSVRPATGGTIHPDPPGQSYLGASHSQTRTIAGAEVTYVRPTRWHNPVAPPPETVFDIVQTTADVLSIDDAFPVIGYASPSLAGADGLGRRATTADTARPHFAFAGHSLSSIAHEYVHTQQNYFEAREYQWVLEGVATFYEHLVGYRHGFASISPLDGPSQETPLLGARRTSVVYDKGAALCFLLDRRLQALTDGESDLSDVVRALDEYDGRRGPTIGHETFKDIVATASGVRLHDWLDERVTQPFVVELPDDLAEDYSGPARPRPTVDGYPRTLRPDRADNWLLVDFAVDIRNAPLDSVELRVTVDNPDAVRVTELSPTSDRASVSRSGDGAGRALSRSFEGSDAPQSLGAVPPARVGLSPVGLGATSLTIAGTVTYQDGTAVPVQPAVGGTRAVVETPPPAEPVVVPRTVPADRPAALFVLDPDPSVQYLWRFDGSGHTQAVGPRIHRRFRSVGEQTVQVTAVDRTGDRTTGTATITVREDSAPGLAAHVDTRCLLRAQGHAVSDWPTNGGRQLPLELVRRCYDDDQ